MSSSESPTETAAKIPPEIFPRTVRTVAIVAPAGPPDPGKVAAGRRWLERAGIRVKMAPHLNAPAEAPYFAAGRSDRMADLNAAIRDPEVDLILCARGGFGSAQLLDGIDFDTLRKRDLPVLGYSDVTALHCAMLKRNAGIPIAAPMAIRLEEELTAAPGKALNCAGLAAAFTAKPAALPLPAPLIPVDGASGAVPDGRPFAANLTVLASLCGTPYFPDLAGRWLILEDVNEPAYRVERSLTQLALAGAFRDLAVLIFGHFTLEGKELEPGTLFRRCALKNPGRTFAGFPFGHVFPLLSVNARQLWHWNGDGTVGIVGPAGRRIS